MAKYLLDTDICIHYLKNNFGLSQKIEAVGIKNCYLSEITIAELTYGAYNSSNFQKHLVEVINIEQLFDIIPIYDSIAKYAEERVRLRQLGQLIPDFDLLIGTTAVTHNMVMVTKNVKHLERIKGIIIENWTQSHFNRFI